MIDPKTTISMISIDGGVRYVPAYMREQLLKQGWKVINNPKAEYFPQFDRSIQGNVEGPDTIEEDNNYLEVKSV